MLTRKIYSLLLLLLGAAPAFAQERFTFSQYEQNRYSYIPAAAGVDDAYNIRSAAHVQPRSDSTAWQAFTLNLYGPVNMSPFSLGVNATHVQTDLYSTTSGQLTGAYMLERWGSRFSFAASLGGLRHNFTGWGLTTTAGDTLDNHVQYLPDIGASFFFMRNVFYVGLSAQHIGNFKLKATPNGEYIGKNFEQQFYLLAGADIAFSEAKLALNPSMLLNYNSDGVEVSAALQLTWNNMLWLGASCKTTQQAGFLVGATLLNKYMLSYSCDFTFDSGKHPPIHEVTLGVVFKKNRNK